MNESGIKGSLAVSKVIFEMIKQGFNVSIPFESSSRYDLIVDRNGILTRIQCKHSTGNDSFVKIKCYSGTGQRHNGIKQTPYTKEDIDYIIAYDSFTSECYYLPISLISGKSTIRLRRTAPKNNQQKGIFYTNQFLTWQD